jgi:hypothetical protein
MRVPPSTTSVPISTLAAGALPHLVDYLGGRRAEVTLLAMDLAAGQPEQHLQPVEHRGHPFAGQPHALEVNLGARFQRITIVREQRLVQRVERK